MCWTYSTCASTNVLFDTVIILSDATKCINEPMLNIDESEDVKLIGSGVGSKKLDKMLFNKIEVLVPPFFLFDKQHCSSTNDNCIRTRFEILVVVGKDVGGVSSAKEEEAAAAATASAAAAASRSSIIANTNGSMFLLWLFAMASVFVFWSFAFPSSSSSSSSSTSSSSSSYNCCNSCKTSNICWSIKEVSCSTAKDKAPNVL